MILYSTMFIFNASDNEKGEIRRLLTLTACAIVAGLKQMEGYLSATAAGPTFQTLASADHYSFPQIKSGRMPLGSAKSNHST